MKSIMLSFFASIFIATTAFAGDATEAIEAENKKFVEAFNAGDTAALAALYTEDGVILPPGSEAITGRDGIADFWGTFLEGEVSTATLTIDEVIKVDKKSMVEVSRFELFDDAGASVGTGKYMIYWRKVDDDWQIHRDIWN